MKYIIKALSTYIVFVILSLLSGCDVNNEIIDTKSPTIDVEEPMNFDELPAGEFVHFHAGFIDDYELATYNIEIHDNFGGHAHGRKASTANDPGLIKWSYKESFLIPDGLILYQALLEEEIMIPENAMAGPFHFITQAIDKAGNSTSFDNDSAVELEVYITNDSQPVVNITNLDGDELDIEVGVIFMVEGEVTDPTTGEYAGMHSIEVILGEGQEEDNHAHGGRITEEDLIDTYFEEDELAQFMVDDTIIIDKIFETINFNLSQEQHEDLMDQEVDHLVLTISVHDEQGNITINNTEVHVLKD